VQVVPNTLGQVGTTPAADVRTIVQKPRGKLMPLNEALGARGALCHGVTPAVPEEQQPLLTAQVTRSLAVEMHDPTAADAAGIVARDPLHTARTLRQGLPHRRGPPSP